MAEVVHVVDAPLIVNGVPYTAQVAARAEGHLWEGWIEFIARDGSDARRTPRETTQPDRAAVAYWAAGLSGTYLEGAFARTLTRPAPPRTRVREAMFDGPAARSSGAAAPSADEAVLDPFSVRAKGETLLRQQLAALDAWHLRNIVRTYELAADSAELEQLDHPELVELIVAAVDPAVAD